MTIASMIYLVLLLCGIVLLVIYSRGGKLLKCAVFTLTTGFTALGLVWLASKFTAFAIAITPLTVMLSGILGVPGVISMLILNLI